MGSEVTITPDAPVSAPSITITPDAQEPSFGEGMAHASVLRNLSEGLGHIADWAEKHRNAAEIAQESEIAKTGKTSTPIAAYTPGAGYDLLSRAARLLSGSTDPKSVLTMAGIGLANTNPFTGIPVDAALVAHGAYGVAKEAPAAFGGDPEAAQRALLSGSEMAGGAAGAAAQVKAAPAALANFKKLMYSGKVTNGVPELSNLAQSLLHPTKMAEGVLRGLLAPPEEVIAQMKAQRAEQFQSEFDKQYGDFNEAKAANAAKLEEQIKLAETARQKEITDWAKLQAQQGAESAAAIKRQALLESQAEKNAPQPSPLPASATPSSGTTGGPPLPSPAPGSRSFTGAIPQGGETPFVSKFTAPEPSKIVTPESSAPPINKTLVSYPRLKLAAMARSGDLEALHELIRNPGEIDVASAVPNSSFLLETGRPTNIYGGPKNIKFPAPPELLGGPRSFARIPPSAIAPVLSDTGWEYGGRNSMGINEFKQPGSNISISVLDKDMNPETLRARIASKLKEFEQ